MDDKRVGVLSYARTPFGRFGGSLRDLGYPELGAVAVRAAVRRMSAESAVDEVALGVNFPVGDRSISRQVALRAGLPEECNAYTVDRACCSSLAAVTLASRGIRLGDTRVAVAGGIENLSRVPYFLPDLRFGTRLGNVQLTDPLVISCPHTGVPRAVQASTEAARFDIGRTEQDEWALRSQERYAAAAAEGLLDEQIEPVRASDGTTLLGADEVPRPTTAAKLAALPTVYESDTVTAGNAPNLSTGATALVLGAVSDLEPGRQSLAMLDGWSMASGDPQKITSMPAVAAQRALAQAGVALTDLDVIEINEAFAAVPLVTTLVLADGDSRLAKHLRELTNEWGGAIAVGHPTGASAARLIMTAVARLRHRGGGTGLVTICGGVGEAEAVVVRMRPNDPTG